MDEEIVAYSILRNSYNLAESGRKAFDMVLSNGKLSRDNISYIVSTGYGRRSIGFQNETEPEIICHARGTLKVTPKCMTIIDIGGQDSKVIELDEGGSLGNFK